MYSHTLLVRPQDPLCPPTSGPFTTTTLLGNLCTPFLPATDDGCTLADVRYRTFTTVTRCRKKGSTQAFREK